MIRLYLIGALVLGLFGAGWQARSWYQDSLDLKESELVAELRKGQSRMAAIVEDKLKGLRANERVIERHRVEIVDRPIYNTECIDADGLRLIEDYASGGATEPAN